MNDFFKTAQFDKIKRQILKQRLVSPIHSNNLIVKSNSLHSGKVYIGVDYAKKSEPELTLVNGVYE